MPWPVLAMVKGLTTGPDGKMAQKDVEATSSKGIKSAFSCKTKVAGVEREKKERRKTIPQIKILP